MFAFECFFTFLIGATAYGAIELSFRGRTHWSMLLTGGVCFLFLYYLTTRTGWPILPLCMTGALFITGLELAVGYLLNIKLGLSLWDYSGLRYNFRGQICPAFSLCWFLLCFPGVGLSGLVFTHLWG